MENSLNSHVNNSLDQEESGWTGYFEDFLSNQIDQNNSSCDSFGSPSLVSDAASFIPLKTSNVNQFAAFSSIDGSPKFPKKLNFKKTRTKEISYDDSLEDTASSPVNSPKVSSLNQMEINPRKREDIIESSLVKGGGSDHDSESQIIRRNEMNYFENNDTTDLKKRGLCLVPLSMLVNYVG